MRPAGGATARLTDKHKRGFRKRVRPKNLPCCANRAEPGPADKASRREWGVPILAVAGQSRDKRSTAGPKTTFDNPPGPFNDLTD